MPAWKLKVSTKEESTVLGTTMRCWLFVAPSPDHTYQRCGELTLTPDEARDLQARLVDNDGEEDA